MGIEKMCLVGIYLFSENTTLRNQRPVFISMLQDENGNIFLSILCFEKRTGNRKFIPKVKQEKTRTLRDVGSLRYGKIVASSFFFVCLFVCCVFALGAVQHYQTAIAAFS